MVRTVVLASIVFCASATSASSPVEKEEAGKSCSLIAAPIRFYQKYISDLRYGHCQFEPSCSQYAIDSIEESGIFEGTALAADRLVRCHSSARQYYSVNAHGRLSDPAHGQAYSTRRPRIPEWLFPPSVPASSLVPDSANAARDPEHEKRLLEIAAFADALSDGGDCYRAETEYERFAFLEQTGEARWWAKMKIGQCLFQQSDWSAAASAYREAARLSPTSAGKSSTWRWAAISHFNAGFYDDGLRDLDASSPTESTDFVQTDIIRGLCLMALGDWRKSGARFREAAHNANEPETRKAAMFFAEHSDTGPSLPRKNATLAGVFSTVIPGSGQAYAKRTYDGMRHFIFDGLLIYTVYWLFKEDNYTGGYMLAGFTLPFYAGNIIGAQRSAEQFNDAIRLQHISYWMDRAEMR